MSSRSKPKTLAVAATSALAPQGSSLHAGIHDVHAAMYSLKPLEKHLPAHVVHIAMAIDFASYIHICILIYGLEVCAG